MQVKEVISFADKAEFHDFARRLYSSDAEWIAPLDKDIEDVFDIRKNKNFEQGNAKRFLLLNEQGETLGRFAAFYIQKTDGRHGGIGFFECAKNDEAARCIFDYAQYWLKTHGCTYMDGPINFGERDKYWGLLVNGFEDPSYQENYNHPYYRDFFESYGFRKIFEQTTSELGMQDFKMERFVRLSERVFRNPTYRFEHYRSNALAKYADDFIYIYNKAWASRPDFSPITKERIESTLHSLKPIMMEEAIWFVYANNEPAGFYVNVLDVNQIFRHLNGKLNLWGKLRFLFYRHFGKIDRIRGIVFGVIPAYQNLGLETGMIMKTFEAMRAKYPHVVRTELSWIGDFNPKMHSLFEALGAKTSKIHYTYRYNFNSSHNDTSIL